MEGQAQSLERRRPVENAVERKQNFVKVERGSQDLSDILKKTMEADGVSIESRLRASVYTRQEIAAETVGLGLDDLLKLAKEKGCRVAIYNPGVAWTGDQWSQREVRDNPFSGKMKESISGEEKTEEEAKSAALDFLAEGGFSLAVTFDPVEVRGFASSLRVDMLARRESMAVVGETLGKGKLESVCWSNGGFKEFQLHRAAVEAIANDGKDSLDVFNNAKEAEDYISLHGKYKVDVYLGGALANQEELATPFKLTSETPPVKTINEAGMKLVNWLIKSVGDLPSKYIPEKLRLLGSRVLEMGRGMRVSDLEVDKLKDLQEKMKGLLGGARILALADTSGSVVASDRQFVGDDLRVIYGDKAIMVETHDWKPLPKIEGVVATFSEDQSPAQHGELKRYGVLTVMRKMVDEIRNGTFDKIKNEQERFVVVDPEAKVYEQKKGTRVRLNPLPQLGKP